MHELDLLQHARLQRTRMRDGRFGLWRCADQRVIVIVIFIRVTIDRAESTNLASASLHALWDIRRRGALRFATTCVLKWCLRCLLGHACNGTLHLLRHLLMTLACLRALVRHAFAASALLHHMREFMGEKCLTARGIEIGISREMDLAVTRERFRIQCIGFGVHLIALVHEHGLGRTSCRRGHRSSNLGRDLDLSRPLGCLSA